MDDRALEEVFLSSEEVFQGALINVEHWQVLLPNGQKALREVVKHRGAAAVVPLDDAGNVTLVRQHRVAVGRFTWEIPAGKLDHVGEDMLDCARRELEEETGLQAAHWQKLTCLYTTPGFCNEKISIYLATGLSQHPAHPDADEFLRLKKIPLEDAVAQCMAGEIRDGKTLVGLLMAQRALQAQDFPMASLSAPIQRFTGCASSREAK